MIEITTIFCLWISVWLQLRVYVYAVIPNEILHIFQEIGIDFHETFIVRSLLFDMYTFTV